MQAMRHSYVTHLIEAGYGPDVRPTAGWAPVLLDHNLGESVSADSKQKTIQRMIAKRPAERSTPQKGGTDG